MHLMSLHFCSTELLVLFCYAFLNICCILLNYFNVTIFIVLQLYPIVNHFLFSCYTLMKHAVDIKSVHAPVKVPAVMTLQ